MRTRDLVTGLVLAAGIAAAGVGLHSSAPAASARQAETAARGSFTVDGVHSVVLFRISHLGVANFHGRFNKVDGSFEINAADPSKSVIDITVDAESIDTANEGRDKHLRSPDFFNSKQFPTITFTSTKVTKNGDGTMALTGDLTLLGKTLPVTASLNFIGEAQTPRGYKAGFEAEFTFKRSEFGMTKYLEEKALGDEIRVTVAIEGDRK